MKSQLILVAACLLCCSSLVESGNLVSTAQIIYKLCYVPGNQSNQTLINEFFACYDKAPGKDLFVQCQTKLFGGPMDNVPVVSSSCSQPLKIPSYGLCLSRLFRENNLDMDSAVATLNACQSTVLGIH